MRFSENRVIAWIVLAVCVLGSVVGLGGAGMAREREKLMDVFYDGTDAKSTSRHSMDAYLDRAEECAQIMANEVLLRLGENADAQQMLSLLAGEDDDLDARYAAYQQLQALSDRLYNAMYGAKLPDADIVSFKAAYDDFWGADKYIRVDAYRKLAADFNDDLSGFPAGLVCGVMGVDELNTFGA